MESNTYTIFDRVNRKLELEGRVLIASSSVLEFANPCNLEESGRFGEKDDPECGGAFDEQALISKYGLTGVGREYVENKLKAARGNEKKIGELTDKISNAQNTMDSLGEERKAQYYPDGKPIPGTDEWLAAHGVSRSVFESRPYVRIEKGEPIPQEVLDLYEGEPKALKQLETVLEQESAWVMVRSAVPGMEEEFGELVPQSRPDNPVVTNKAELAAKGSGVTRAEARVEQMAALDSESVVALQEARIEGIGKRLARASSETKESFLAEKQDKLLEATEAYAAGKEAGLDKGEIADLKKVRDRAKLNLESAESKAGFLFKDGDSAYQAIETENLRKQLTYAEGKLDKYVDDPGDAVLHEQKMAGEGLQKAYKAYDEVAIKYIFPPNLTTGEKAKVKAALENSEDEGGGSLAGVDLGKAGRVEIHGTQNIENFVSGRGRVYLAMEGNIKSDAIQTAIQREGETGASVISVPSVTLWRHEEMLAVAREYLSGGREVVLIPDADGVKNANVRNESRALQSMLESVGASVVVAAPPLDYTSEKTGRQKKIGDVQKVTLPSGAIEELKGVDDYLGAGRVVGASLSGLDVLGRTVPKSAISSAIAADLDMPTISRPTATNTLNALSNLLGERGSGRVSNRMMDAAIGSVKGHGSQSIRSIGFLENAGLVRVERLYDPAGLLEGVRRFHPNMTADRAQELRRSGVISSSDLDFDRPIDHGYQETPIVTIVNPSHRSRDVAPKPLGGGERVIRTQAGADRYGGRIGQTISQAVAGNESESEEENPFESVLSLKNPRVDVLKFWEGGE